MAGWKLMPLSDTIADVQTPAMGYDAISSDPLRMRLTYLDPIN